MHKADNFYPSFRKVIPIPAVTNDQSSIQKVHVFVVHLGRNFLFLVSWIYLFFFWSLLVSCFNSSSWSASLIHTIQGFGSDLVGYQFGIVQEWPQLDGLLATKDIVVLALFLSLLALLLVRVTDLVRSARSLVQRYDFALPRATARPIASRSKPLSVLTGTSIWQPHFL